MQAAGTAIGVFWQNLSSAMRGEAQRAIPASGDAHRSQEVVPEVPRFLALMP